MNPETGSILFTFLPLVIMLLAVYFMMIRPQRKKEKETANMRNSIEIGDGITTIGGIVGHVVSIKEDTFVLETGNDRVKMRFKRWAIQEVEKLTLDTTTDSGSAKSPKASNKLKTSRPCIFRTTKQRGMGTIRNETDTSMHTFG